MSYLALYRKYRPQSFTDVCGQNYIVKILEHAIVNNKLSHAYLFSGPRGTGKTTIAKLIAKIVNCENSDGLNACDKCESCLSFNQKNHPDIIEMDAASNNGVDEIREIRDNVSLMPVIGKFKVYIIDEVHMLSIGAFNALLKTLEEPPRHVIFILATTELNKVPETIISRCQCFSFSRISDNDIVKRLRYISDSENINISDDVLKLIAQYSDGGMRDAIGTLDKLYCCSDNITLDDFYDLKGLVDKSEYQKLLEFLLNNDPISLISEIENFSETGKNMILLAEGLLNYIKEKVLADIKNSVSNDIDLLYKVMDQLNEIVFNIKKSSFPKTVFEVGLLKINYSLHITNNIMDGGKKFDTEIYEQKNVNKSSKDIKINDSLVEKMQKESNIKNVIKYDKQTRINNALCLANKDLLLDMKNNWHKFNNYLTDKRFSAVISYFIDGTLRVAGEKDVIISLKYESLIENADLNIDKIQELFKIVFNQEYKIAFVSDYEWEICKKRYIDDKKNGIIYQYVEEKVKNDIINSDSLPDIDIDENVKAAIDLFGNDVVEIN